MKHFLRRILQFLRKKKIPKPVYQKNDRVFDCFTFFNELDLLEIRLETLNGVVDGFILVESTKTFTGKNKPLYYQETKDRFEKFAHKITHVIVDDMPDSSNAWELEFHQRNAIVKGFERVAIKPSDVVLITDIDEIPNPEIVLNYRDTTGVKALNMRLFYFYLNYELKHRWNVPKMMTYNDLTNLKQLNPSQFNGLPQDARTVTGYEIANAGWHFSYLGDIQSIINKIDSFAHQDLNHEGIANEKHIKECIRRNIDIYGRNIEYEKVEIDLSYPQYITNNISRFEKFIIGVEEKAAD